MLRTLMNITGIFVVVFFFSNSRSFQGVPLPFYTPDVKMEEDEGKE